LVENSEPPDYNNEAPDNKPDETIAGGMENVQPYTDKNREWSQYEKKHPLEYAIAILLALTMIATGVAACYTKKQWETAADAEKRTLRAYVIVPSGSDAKGNNTIRIENAQPGQPIIAWVTMQNQGQTPAYKLRQGIVVKVLPFPLPNGFSYPIDTMYNLSLIGIHDQVFGSKHVAVFSEYEKLSLATQVSAIYIYGTINYVDIFGDTHFTNYCVFFKVASPVSNYYDHHNDADDAPEKLAR
jgi:hypothetical protein